MLYIKCSYTINRMALNCFFKVHSQSLKDVELLRVKRIMQDVKSVGGLKAENLKIETIEAVTHSDISNLDRLSCFEINEWRYCSNSNRNNLFLGFEGNTPVFEYVANRYEIDSLGVPSLTRGFRAIDYLFVVPKPVIEYFSFHVINNPQTQKALTQFVEQNELHEWAYINPDYVIECLKTFTANYDERGSSVVFETLFKPEIQKDGTMFKPLRSMIKFVGLFDKCQFKGRVTIKFKYLKNGTHKTEIKFEAV